MARRCVRSRNLVREEAIAPPEAAKYKPTMGGSARKTKNKKTEVSIIVRRLWYFLVIALTIKVLCAVCCRNLMMRPDVGRFQPFTDYEGP